MTKTATRLLLALTLVACGASDEMEAESAPAEAPAPVTPEAVPVANDSVVEADPLPEEGADDEAARNQEEGTELAERPAESDSPAAAPQAMQPPPGLPSADPMPSNEGMGGRVEGPAGGVIGGHTVGAGSTRGAPAPARPRAFDIEE